VATLHPLRLNVAEPQPVFVRSRQSHMHGTTDFLDPGHLTALARDAIKTWSVMETIISVMGLALTGLIAVFV